MNQKMPTSSSRSVPTRKVSRCTARGSIQCIYVCIYINIYCARNRGLLNISHSFSILEKVKYNSSIQIFLFYILLKNYPRLSLTNECVNAAVHLYPIWVIIHGSLLPHQLRISNLEWGSHLARHLLYTTI